MSKKTETETEAKTEAKELQTAATGKWGIADIFEPDDLVLPRIILMQGNSKPVSKKMKNSNNEPIVSGDIMSMPSMRKLGDFTRGIDVIMFHADKRLILVEKSNGRIRKNEPLTQHNRQYDRQYAKLEGIDCEYSIAYRLFCLLPSELNQLPYLLLLKKGEVQTARRLLSDFKILREQDIPSAAKVVHFFPEDVDRNGNNWTALNYRESRNSTVREISAAKYWYDLIKTSNVVADGGDEEGDPEPASAPAHSLNVDTEADFQF